MAEHTKLHLWMNTGIATLALLASGGSAFQAWKTYQLKAEAFRVVSQPTLNCKPQFLKIVDERFVGLCWTVTLVNQSESRVSILNHQVAQIAPGAKTYVGGIGSLESEKGEPISFPIQLDGGDARVFLVRAPIRMPETVWKVVETLEKEKPGRWTMEDLQDANYTSGHDLFGNAVKASYFERKLVFVEYEKDYRTALAELRLMTARGTEIVSQLSYPPLSDPLFSLR